MIQYLEGDLLEPITKEPIKLLVHCVNNVYSFGSGIAGAIAKKYPVCKQRYMDRASWGLGDVQYVEIGKGLYIVNLCGQRNVGNFYETIPFRYESLQDGLIQIREDLRTKKVMDKSSLSFPRIGCSLAGGSWAKVEEVIVRVFKDTYIPIYVYDKPGVTTFNP
jgi:O-acetyl-ADP-ribose deacetylase (regulator of RNase III)